MTDILRARLFEKMALIREVEGRLLILFAQGKLFGTTHTCVGQEAVAVGVLDHFTPEDIIFSNHRCHGHYLAFTNDVRGLIGEVMGRSSGVCGGKGGSQHLHRKNVYTNGVLGSIVPVATGVALAEKRLDRRSVTAVFIGDGALGEGAVYEAMNIASLWSAPILFVIENNHVAQSTPSHLQLAGRIVDRPLAFGIVTSDLVAADVEEVHAVAGQAVERIRNEQRPGCLVLETFRLNPHSKGDDFRAPAEIDAARRRDPLARLRSHLPPAAVAEIEERCRVRVNEAVEFALDDSFPGPSSIPSGVKA